MHIESYLSESMDALRKAMDNPQFKSTVKAIADAVTVSMRRGGKLLICGNGGSAADAQHVAGEFVSRFIRERKPLPAIALTTDTSVITAIGNDYDFSEVFARQVDAMGRTGDVLLAISTSGLSKNIIAAIDAANERNMIVVGLTGDGITNMPRLCDHCLQVESVNTPIIQQVHMVALHMVCGLVEENIFAQEEAA